MHMLKIKLCSHLEQADNNAHNFGTFILYKNNIYIHCFLFSGPVETLNMLAVFYYIVKLCIVPIVLHLFILSGFGLYAMNSEQHIFYCLRKSIN